MAAAVTIGTAGHIDHGKTALVRALTGVDCDRLPEERERGITIELGFAELDLGSGESAGMVDVPGHERFVRTMLAGAAAIDVALLVIAADDGVMPQTREHLAILDLLGVRRGVVALTKSDLSDPDWRALVADDVRDRLAGTRLEGSPIIETSARTGDGIESLREALRAAVQDAAQQRRTHEAEMPFRLMVDRVFPVAGRGTVVTGTAASGRVRPGDELTLHPGLRPVRVRGVQSHGRDVDEAARGARVAVALAGVHHAELERGHELATPGALREGPLIAAELRMLPDAARRLRPRERVRLHTGTGVRSARIRLLTGTGLAAGESGLALVAADGPVPLAYDQPFVIRSESPSLTLGGGRVLVAAARPLRRAAAAAIGTLETLAAERDPVRRLDAAWTLRLEPAVSAADAFADAGLGPVDAARAVDELLEAGRLYERGGLPPRYMPGAVARARVDRLRRAIDRHHAESPLSAGLPREQLAGAMPGIDPSELDGIVGLAVNGGAVATVAGDRLARPGFEPDLSPRHRKIRASLVASYRDAGFRPPEVLSAAGEGAAKSDVMAMARLCVAEGELVHLGGGTYLAAEHESELRSRIRRELSPEGNEGMTMSQLRMILDTTRKHAVPFGEYLDRVGVTRRRGDVRVLADG